MGKIPQLFLLGKSSRRTLLVKQRYSSVDFSTSSLMPLCQTIFVVTWQCWDTSHQLFWGLLIVILHIHLLLLHTIFVLCKQFCRSQGGRKEKVWQHRAAHLSSFGIQPCQETVGRCAMPGDPLEQLHFWEKLCVCTSSVWSEGIKVFLALILGAAQPVCCPPCTADFPLAHLSKGHAEEVILSLWNPLIGTAQRALFTSTSTQKTGAWWVGISEHLTEILL